MDSSSSPWLNMLGPDKTALADCAQKKFDAWDSDQSGGLSTEELTRVTLSQDARLSERSTAAILLNNFDKARDLCALKTRTETEGLSKVARDEFSAMFGGDNPDVGITKRDLTALSTLASAESQSKFVADVNWSKVGKAFGLGGLTVFSAGVAVASGLAFQKTSLKAEAGTLAVSSAALAAMEGWEFVDTITHNDTPGLEEQLKKRRAMLDSWQMPT